MPIVGAADVISSTEGWCSGSILTHMLLDSSGATLGSVVMQCLIVLVVSLSVELNDLRLYIKSTIVMSVVPPMTLLARA